ncbi:MAG: tetratricopeptide repeat protein [Planctomycetota bacterium]
MCAWAHSFCQSSQAIFTLGDMAFQEEDWNAARKDFEQYLTFGTDQVAADDAMLKLGLAQLRSDELDDALATFETMLATFDDSTHRAQAMFERGQALVLLDRDEDAEAGFEALLREHPQTSFTAHALNHLGTIAQSAGRFDDAAQYFERVAAADPSLSIVPETMFQRGQALLASRRHADAEEAFSVLLTSYPDSARAASAAALRAIATARQDEHERALTMIADVERDGLNDLDDTLRASMLYEKAWCQRNREDDTAAEMTYQDVIAISNGGPLRLHSMLELAELQAEDERYGTAQQQLETLLTSLDGNDDAPADLRRQAMYRLGVCEFRLEAFEDASKRFEAYLARYPDSDVEASARLLCGESHYKQGRHEQAIEHLTVVTTSHAKSDAYGPALLRLGESQAVLQYWSQSEESYRAFMAHAPESPQWFQAQFGIGWALDNRGEHDAAIEAYQPVVYNHRGPTAARAQFQIGECLFALERYDEAVRELVKVDILYGYPEWSAAALYEAGRCFQAMNDPVRARQQYEQVRTDHEGTDWARLASERLEELSRTTLPGR